MPEIKTIPLHNEKTLLVVSGLPKDATNFILDEELFYQAGVFGMKGISHMKKLPFPCVLIGLLSECREEQARAFGLEKSHDEGSLRVWWKVYGEDRWTRDALESLRSLLTSHGVTDQNPLLLLKK